MGFSIPTHFIHVTDPPFVLERGKSLIGHRFVCGGALYGRVLFTEVIAVVAQGDNLIAECLFERI